MSAQNALATRQEAQITELPRRAAGDIMFDVLAKGDLANLNNEEIARYEVAVCESVGLNPLTKPFDVISLPGREGEPERKVLYANRNAGDQLTKVYNITRQIIARELVDGVYVVTARATSPDGRSDESIGAVSLVKEGGTWKTNQSSGKRYFDPDGTTSPLRPDERANKMMHAETKAKRRAVLSLVGLSMLDESELDTMRLMPPARAAVAPREPGIVIEHGRTVDAETGEITEAPITENTMRRLHVEMKKRCDGDAHEALREFAYKTLPLDDDFTMNGISEKDAAVLLAKVLDLPVINEEITWTGFWKQAKAAGLNSKAEVEQLLGRTINDLQPQEALDLVNDALMPAVDDAVARAVQL